MHALHFVSDTSTTEIQNTKINSCHNENTRKSQNIKFKIKTEQDTEQGTGFKK